MRQKVSMQRMYHHLVCQFLLSPVSATYRLGQILPRLSWIPSTLHIAKLSAPSIRSYVPLLRFVFLLDDIQVLTHDTQIHPHTQMAFSALNWVSKVFFHHARCLLINKILDS